MMNHIQQAWSSRVAAGRRLFHGTDAKLGVGEYLEPGKGSNQYAVQSGGDKVFLTDSIGMAYFYAVLGPLQSGRFGEPVVYEVDPEGAQAWSMGEWICDRALITRDVTGEGRAAFKSEWESTWKPAVQEMATDPATQRILLFEFERKIAAKPPHFIGYLTLDRFIAAIVSTGFEAGWLEADGKVFSINGSHDEYPGETRAAWNSGCMRLIIERPSLIVEAKQLPNALQLDALCAITNRCKLRRLVYAFPGGLDNQMFFDSHHEAEQWLHDNLDPSVTSKRVTAGVRMWHGSPSGDLRGGAYGLHIGTQQAAREALEARIGRRADGKDWDGTQEYGKTLIASTGHGYGVGPGMDDSSKPHYPTGKATYGDRTPIPLTVRPDLFEVEIIGEMSNTPQTPHEDFKANGYMKAQIGRGQAKRGYYYTNVGEDSGSISAVVPGPSHVRRV